MPEKRYQKISQCLKEYTEKMLESSDTARRALIEEGLYSAAGELVSAFNRKSSGDKRKMTNLSRLPKSNPNKKRLRLKRHKTGHGIAIKKVA